MGQAKRRGTFEQRRAGAIARRDAEQIEADRRADLAYAERLRAGRTRPRDAGASTIVAVAVMGAAFAASAWPNRPFLYRNSRP